jgi:hypothetical protein
VTDAPGNHGADALAVVREIVRRSGHEIRNALNGVAVNVEVVRSRNGRAPEGAEVNPFAERAAAGVVKATSLTNGVLTVVGAVVAALAKGGLSTPGHGDISEIEVMIYGGRAPIFVSEIAHLAQDIGVSVEQRGESVILRVLPEDKSHSQN